MQRTPSQTIGPFFHEAMRWPDGGRMQFAGKGEAVILTGRILDGAGAPVADALVEAWQRPQGFARVETAKDGSYRIETVMPGGALACIDVALFARGLLKPLRTRVYLADEARVRADPLVKAIAGSPRLHTLIASRAEGVGAGGAVTYRWDVRLQGVGETVFFAP
jgi:protocatechuate 3,4-dioxygenase alpha subunit